MRNYLSLAYTNNKLAAAIAEVIKQYYPIGSTETDTEYINYPGFVKRGEIIQDNIGNDENYKNRWVNFCDNMAKELKKEINGTTYGYVPGFSAELMLERSEYGSLIHTKKLLFAVSLLGPFYSICGIDETMIIEHDKDSNKYYRAINMITASPYKEFANDFDYLKEKIEADFASHVFVPIRLALSYVKDLHVQFMMQDECYVYNALFNPNFNSYYPQGYFRGDSFYGFEKTTDINIEITPPSIL